MIFHTIGVKIRDFLKNSKIGFLFRTQDSIISAAIVIAISTGMSAALGLLKNRLLTSYFGVSTELAVFYTADRIPNMIYSIVVVGAISTVFIPVFTSIYKKDKENAMRAAASLVGTGVAVFSLLGFFVFMFAPSIIAFISAYKFDDTSIQTGANLMRIMIVSQLVLVLSSFISSILQSFKLFVVPAMAPIVYNIGMLLGITVLSNSMGIYGPAIGVFIGSLAHLLIQLPYFLSAKDLTFQIPKKLTITLNSDVKEVLRLVPARILSVGLNQLVSTVNNSLSILVSISSTVLLRNANQLQFFPVNIFGLSMASAALPILSEYSEQDDKEKFKKIFLTTFHQTMFLVLPASILFMIMRIPIVRLVYGVENYSWESTVKTSYALAFFSLSIFSQSAVYLLTRAFYSLKDTATPVKVSIITILVNVTLSIYFVRYLGLGIWAIAFSYSLTSLADMFLMMLLLSKRLGYFDKQKLLIPVVKICYATLFMGITIYVPLKFLDKFVFDTTRTLELAFLTMTVTVLGSATYLLFTHLFKVEEIVLFYKLIAKLNIKGMLSKSIVHVSAEHTENK